MQAFAVLFPHYGGEGGHYAILRSGADASPFLGPADGAEPEFLKKRRGVWP
ncbi:MAG: hypothetical protein IJ816_03965 [Alloprevotella sp.]|nr:hypothetical protein [Alloprevotella sp.]